MLFPADEEGSLLLAPSSRSCEPAFARETECQPSFRYSGRKGESRSRRRESHDHCHPCSLTFIRVQVSALAPSRNIACLCTAAAPLSLCFPRSLPESQAFINSSRRQAFVHSLSLPSNCCSLPAILCSLLFVSRSHTDSRESAHLPRCILIFTRIPSHPHFRHLD